MNKIDKELERILQKRIKALVECAKYYPATVLDVPGAAYEVLRPFLEDPVPFSTHTSRQLVQT